MKILLVGDIHLADKPPSIRTDTYAQDILDKLAHTVEIAAERAVDAVAWAGDVFHIKTPSRTSHGLVQRTADIVKSYHCPVYIVPGNHDVQHDRMESLSEQPLGVLFKAGARMLDGDPEDGSPLFGVPWLQDWAKDLPAYMQRWRDSEAKLMVTHAPIVPPGETRPFEVLDAEAWWAELMGRGGSVFYGHMHDPDGFYGFVHAKEVYQFCNQGAISRGSLHESSLNRVPAVTIWDSTGRGGDHEMTPFSRVDLKHRPAEAVFRLVEHEEGIAKQHRLDDFLEGVEKTQFVQVSKESIVQRALEEGLSQQVRDLIEESLEAVS